MIEYKTAENSIELQQIIELQAINLPSNISDEELKQQGFVTVNHDLDLLTRMNSPYGHIIAKDGDKIAGYALVMLKDFADEVPVLFTMFERINLLQHKGEKLGNTQYFVMGQVCVAKDYRSQGVFAGLYQHMKKCMSPHFDYIVTQISSRNTRSKRAHEKVGFETIKTYKDDHDDWEIVLWDWE